MALSDFIKLSGKKKDIPSPGPAPLGAQGYGATSPFAPSSSPSFAAPPSQFSGLSPGLARGLVQNRETPQQMIIRMQSQGLNQQQIIAQLSSEGLSQTQIYDAIDQASRQQSQSVARQNTSSGVAGSTDNRWSPGGDPQPDQGPLPPPIDSSENEWKNQSSRLQNNQQMNPARVDQVDELIEKTVQEKWREFSRELKTLDEFKARVETRLAQLETNVANLHQQTDALKNAVIAKIKDYDTSILNVGTEMKAMEQVFQKILPELAHNVTELSRVTNKIGPSASPKVVKK